MEISIKRALISVADKTGIIEFAKELRQLGVEILSTGGTSALLRKHDIEVKEVSEYTGFEEIMDGRVKSLHPKIHASLLYRPKIDEQVLRENNCTPIDLLVVNLYPFAKTIADKNHSLAEAIEQIDIGGPAMIRAAAKNFLAVTTVVVPDDYGQIINILKSKKSISREERFIFAKKAFAYIAHYDADIANYLQSYINEDKRDYFPQTLTIHLNKDQELRYGENPHQIAASYKHVNLNLDNSKQKIIQIQGKPLSYNNLIDTDAAINLANSLSIEFSACVIVKHANPCGVAISDLILTSYQKAFSADKESAFGGIIAFNKELDIKTAEEILNNQFVEVIIAPKISTKAIEYLSLKPQIRVLEVRDMQQSKGKLLHFKNINSGLLVQTLDNCIDDRKNWEIVTGEITDSQLLDLEFAWQVVRFVKSNAIVYAKYGQTLGIGMGQTSRIASVNFGIERANKASFSLQGSVMASDAFFPFPDSIEQAFAVGIKAIIQPGGSKRDNEVIAAAKRHNIAMIFTHKRHFAH